MGDASNSIEAINVQNNSHVGLRTRVVIIFAIMLLATSCVSSDGGTEASIQIEAAPVTTDVSTDETYAVALFNQILRDYGHLPIYPGGPLFSNIIEPGQEIKSQTYQSQTGLHLGYSAPENFYNFIQLNPNLIFHWKYN